MKEGKNMSNTGRNLYDRLSTELIDSGEAQAGTMMGFPSLRFRSCYFACKDKPSGALIVKLTEERVSALVKSRQARPFEPAGHLFKTWAVIHEPDEPFWRLVLQEARELAQQSVTNSSS